MTSKYTKEALAWFTMKNIQTKTASENVYNINESLCSQSPGVISKIISNSLSSQCNNMQQNLK